jgi:hypothetical protein
MVNNMAGYALSVIGAIFIGQLGALSLSSSVLANSVYNCTGGSSVTPMMIFGHTQMTVQTVRQ